MTDAGARALPGFARGPVGGALLLKTILHAASFTSYGYFRDELYYLACADRPAAGYVDQPPFSILVLSVWRSVFGDSLVSLHVPPLLAGLATVVLVAGLSRRFGGGRAAQGLAALAAACAPIWLGMDRYYSMNAFDILLWAAAALLVARVVEEDPGPRASRIWVALGVILGLGLLNKLSVLWLGLGLFAGLVLTTERRWLKTPGPWLAGGIAALLFLPHVLWQVANGWPTLEFMRQSIRLGEKLRTLDIA